MKKTLSQSMKSFLLSSLSGILTGLMVSGFMVSLDWVVDFKMNHEWLLYLLPAAGLFLGRMKTIETHLILEEVHSPKEVLPARMGPLIWFSTLLSHFFGASIGREGAASQIGASFSDQLARIFKFSPHERRSLIVCGLGAGLGAAIGTPWAGAVFGLELFRARNMSFIHAAECLIASFLSVTITQFLLHREPLFEHLPVFTMSGQLFAASAVAAVAFGILAFSFERSHHLVTGAYEKLKVDLKWRPVLGGIIFVALIKCFALEKFESLSLPMIKDAFSTANSWSSPLIKLGLTAISLGSGFRGGEFIPLVVIGTTAGTWMESQLHTGTLLLSALGYTTLFGSTGRVPITASIMAIELFGLDIGVYAVLCSFIAYGMKSLLDRKLKTTHTS